MRNLIEIINEIVKVAPELYDSLASISDSVPYTAPEAMHLRWCDVASVLNAEALDHPKKSEIAAIFWGTKTNL